MGDELQVEPDALSSAGAPTGLPTARESPKATATNIGTAADRYEQTDQKAPDVNDWLAEFDSQYGSPSASGASTDVMGQFGQLMQVPIRMAQQAIQVPMQMGGGLGQGGAGAAGTDAGQAQSSEKGEQQPLVDEAGRQDPDERDEQKQDEEKREGVAAPDSGAQRAPATPPSAPAVPSGPVDPSVLL